MRSIGRAAVAGAARLLASRPTTGKSLAARDRKDTGLLLVQLFPGGQGGSSQFVNSRSTTVNPPLTDRLADRTLSGRAARRVGRLERAPLEELERVDAAFAPEQLLGAPPDGIGAELPGAAVVGQQRLDGRLDAGAGGR